MPIDIGLVRVDRGGDIELIIQSELSRHHDNGEIIVRELSNFDKQYRFLLVERDHLSKVHTQLKHQFRTTTDVEKCKAELRKTDEKLIEFRSEIKKLEDEIKSRSELIGNVVDCEGASFILECIQINLEDQVPCKTTSEYLQNHADMYNTIVNIFQNRFGNVQSWDDMKKNILDEKRDLPFACVNQHNNQTEIRIISQGDATHSYRVIYEVTLWLLSCALPNTLKLVPVEASRLAHNATIGFEIQNTSGVILCCVNNTSDFDARERGLRSGHRKPLQQRVKYVHIVEIFLDPLIAPLLIKDKLLDGLPEKEQLCKPLELYRAIRIDLQQLLHTDRLKPWQLEVLDSWFRTHPFVRVEGQSDDDRLLREVVARVSYPKVQYPFLANWEHGVP